MSLVIPIALVKKVGQFLLSLLIRRGAKDLEKKIDAAIESEGAKLYSFSGRHTTTGNGVTGLIAADNPKEAKAKVKERFQVIVSKLDEVS